MFAEELSIQRADALMACSRVIAEITSRAHGVDRELIDVVHCGVDSRRFHPTESPESKANRPTVLFVGNIVENKGIHTVVDAVLRLRARYPAIHLQVLGKVPADSDLMHGFLASIEAAGAVRNFEFVGHVEADSLPEYYRRAHVFCSPAEFEGGVANVYLEAMACGCPVVASTAGGGPEAVTDGETGRLVPPNDVAATASAIDQLLGDADARRKMGVAARRRVEDYFAMDRYIERVLNVYEKAIDRSNRHPERWEDVRE
jgi:glycosyltransferase involved in cell wall biosynthesis